MKITQSDYHSYLLRLWRVRGDGDHWRASLEDVMSGKLRGFEDLAGLLDYLEALTTANQLDKVLAGQEETCC